jgi:hypothetical protein
MKRLIRGDTPRKYLNEKLARCNPRYPLTADGHMRASSIVRICPREEALCARDNVIRHSNITAKQMRVFLFGRAFELMLRENLDELYGNWQCPHCGFIVDEMVRCPDKCEQCGLRDMEYREMFFLDKEAGIGGHCDGVFEWNGDLYLLELKTATSFFYKQFCEYPGESHYGQIQIYMHLAKIKKGLIWYFNKETADDCMWLVDYDPQTVATLIDKPTQLRQYFKDGTLPLRICPTLDCERAKRCEVGEACFKE